VGELVLLLRLLVPWGALWLIALAPFRALAAPLGSDAGAGRAQRRGPEETAPALNTLPLGDGGDQNLDPIGLDDSTGRELDRAAERLEQARRRAQQVVTTQSARHGDVLTSIDAVSEVAHRVQVTLAQGLAFVEVELVFASRSATPSELAYRLPLPNDSALYALKVCRLPPEKSAGKPASTARCVEARVSAREQNPEARVSAREQNPEARVSAREQNPEARVSAREQNPDAVPGSGRNEVSANSPSGEGIGASAQAIEDARGRALSLRAAAIDKSAMLALYVSYVARAPLHGGVVRFRLPARGYDPRAAASEVTLHAKGFSELIPAETRALDAHLALDLHAKLSERPPAGTSTTKARCGGKPCTRSYEAALPAPLITRPTWLLLDTSPSMQGPARNAADQALASLLTLLPEATPLRIFAFAAREQELGRFTPDRAPLKRLSDALTSDLGAATLPARVLDAHKAELFSERPRVLLMSDGRFDRATLAALSLLTRRGVELWLCALAKAPPEVAAAFVGVVSASEVADEALDERLRAALGPRTTRGLPAGEERVRESSPKKRQDPRAGESWLSYWLARGDAMPFVTSAYAAAGFIVAPGYQSAAPKAAQPDTGMPKESVLSMLRTQLVPAARACLRTDRKGRADYAVSLTFHALFAEREAYDVRVEGRIPDALRSCLADVIGRLRIPAFSGRIRVRYPIHTEREAESPVIELEGEALEQVNRVISGK
jgi:hypothetical protein